MIRQALEHQRTGRCGPDSDRPMRGRPPDPCVAGPGATRWRKPRGHHRPGARPDARRPRREPAPWRREQWATARAGGAWRAEVPACGRRAALLWLMVGVPPALHGVDNAATTVVAEPLDRAHAGTVGARRRQRVNVGPPRDEQDRTERRQNAAPDPSRRRAILRLLWLWLDNRRRGSVELGLCRCHVAEQVWRPCGRASMILAGPERNMSDRPVRVRKRRAG